MPVEEKIEYRNATPHNIGVVKIDRHGEEKGSLLRPGESAYLTEDERIATARAPRDQKDNPFGNGSLERVGDPSAHAQTDRVFDAPRAAPPAPEPAPEPEEVTAPVQVEETAAAPVPAGPAPVGEYAAKEEVATPVAQAPKGTEAINVQRKAPEKTPAKPAPVQAAPPKTREG